MFKQLLMAVFIFMVFTGVSIFGEYRTFTNKSGKTINAKVLDFDDGEVTLRLDSGKEYTFSAKTLSEDDQKYLRKWAVSNFLKSERTLGFSTKRRSGKVSKNDAIGVTYKKFDMFYEVEVENKTFKDVSNLEIQYRFYYMENQPGSTGPGKLKYIEGSHKVPYIPAKEKAVFSTEKIKMTESKLDSNYYWASGADDKSKDSLGGIWLKVYSKKQLVREYSVPTKLREKQRWE